jgi:hypothetical protein
MISSRVSYVITSINPTSPGMTAIGARAIADGFEAIVVGDRKGPFSFGVPGINFYSLQDQLETKFLTSTQGRIDSYTRKLSGYLIAIANGADFIRETDDDNTPYEKFFNPIIPDIHVREFAPENRWSNIYAAFTERHVWPRGFPLNEVHNPASANFSWREAGRILPVEKVVIQGLADGDPDVDAIYRLTTADRDEIKFVEGESVLIPHNTWTPFNSQATQWPKGLFPLMYLPATCSFRMTDIWRSFVAQRLMRELDSHLVYSSSIVFQDRNDHDLMRDFADEIEGYQGYNKLIDLLESLVLEVGEASIFKNLRVVYKEMAKQDFVSADELPLLENWLSDLKTLGFSG